MINLKSNRHTKVIRKAIQEHCQVQGSWNTCVVELVFQISQSIEKKNIRYKVAKRDTTKSN